MQRPNFLCSFLFVLTTTSALATEVPCDYATKDKVVYEGQIESVKSVSKKIQINPEIKDIRKCVVSIEARVKGKWYPSKGEYMFGPDMCQMDACNHAENRAKTKVMNKIIPETLKSEKNLKCTLTNVRKSCKVIIMNTSIGKVKLMESCEK